MYLKNFCILNKNLRKVDAFQEVKVNIIFKNIKNSFLIIGVIYTNDKISHLEVKQRIGIIDTLHAHLLQRHSPVGHL